MAASEENAGTPRIVGILLAAGRGARFDPAGMRDKLLQPVPSLEGEAVAVCAARTLLAALPSVIAVVRFEPGELAERLRREGCTVVACPTANDGMAATLVHGLRHADPAAGWVIALGDMPYVQAQTIRALATAVASGAGIALPVCDGRRGNPVAFGRRHRDALLALRGDEGARRLLQEHHAVQIATSDAGVLRDIDTAADL